VQKMFLQQLLTLQQDGSAAISSPGNWGAEPLLRIRTNLDNVVEGLINDITAGVDNREVARWHFFVGSPGNGKSAGTGSLARGLVSAGFAVRDTDGCDLKEIPLSKTTSSIANSAASSTQEERTTSTAFRSSGSGIVVLHDPRTLPPCPREKFETTRHG
jgi:hypothetical protein